MQIRDVLFGKWILPVLVYLLITFAVSNVSTVVTRYTVDLGDGAQEGLLIAQLSDIHLIRSEYQKRSILERVEKEKPDLIVFSGDLVDTVCFEVDSYREKTLEFCREVCQIAPVYFVYGNHEVELINSEIGREYALKLEAMGIRTLNQGCERFEKGGRTYELLGIEDPEIQGNDPDCDYDPGSSHRLLEALTAGIEDSGYPRIMFAHRPELLDCYADGFGIDVVLTGHAHGGQIRLPYVGVGLYDPTQGFFPKYTSGIYRRNGTRMVVSRGLGNSRFPIRIFNDPEIVMIEIR